MNIPSLPKGPIIPNIPTIPDVSWMHLNSIIEEASIHTAEINKALEEMSNEREQRYQDGVSREERMIELLESIDKNTSILNDIFKILDR